MNRRPSDSLARLTTHVADALADARRMAEAGNDLLARLRVNDADALVRMIGARVIDARHPNEGTKLWE